MDYYSIIVTLTVFDRYYYNIIIILISYYKLILSQNICVIIMIC